MIGHNPGDSFDITFKGSAVAIQVIAGPKAGIIQHSVDGSDWVEQDLFVAKNSFKLLKTHMQPLVGEKVDLQKVLGGGASKQQSEARRLATWGADTADDLDAKIESVAALSLISPDDPPIFMSYGMSPTAKLPSDPKRAKGWLIHHVFFGIALKEKMDSLNVESNLQHGGAKSKYESSAEFMIEKLTGK